MRVKISLSRAKSMKRNILYFLLSSLGISRELKMVVIVPPMGSTTWQVVSLLQ